MYQCTVQNLLTQFLCTSLQSYSAHFKSLTCLCRHSVVSTCKRPRCTQSTFIQCMGTWRKNWRCDYHTTCLRCRRGGACGSARCWQPTCHVNTRQSLMGTCETWSVSATCTRRRFVRPVDQALPRGHWRGQVHRIQQAGFLSCVAHGPRASSCI